MGTFIFYPLIVLTFHEFGLQRQKLNKSKQHTRLASLLSASALRACCDALASGSKRMYFLGSGSAFDSNAGNLNVMKI